MFYGSRRKTVIGEAGPIVGEKLLWFVLMLNTENKTQTKIFNYDAAIHTTICLNEFLKCHYFG